MEKLSVKIFCSGEINVLNIAIRNIQPCIGIIIVFSNLQSQSHSYRISLFKINLILTLFLFYVCVLMSYDYD